MQAQTIRCSVTIDRVAPWAKDASVSTKGYERGARFYSSDTTANEVNAWISANAPEVDPNGTRQPVFTRGEAFTYPDRTGTMRTAYENRDYYFLQGRDARGWRTEVYVQFTYPEIMEEITEEPAPANMQATITQTYGASERRYNLYTLTIDEKANELRNAVVAYGSAHNHPDDAYLLGRGLMGAILGDIPEVGLSQPEVDLIVTVTTWADSVIAQYRTENAGEISEYEQCEGKTLTDMEVFCYATA